MRVRPNRRVVRDPLTVDGSLLWVVRGDGTALHVAWQLDAPPDGDWKTATGVTLCAQRSPWLRRPREAEAKGYARCNTCIRIRGIDPGIGVPGGDPVDAGARS